MRVRFNTSLWAVLLFAGAHLRAHDFWLASGGMPVAGQPWTVTAQVGERFPTPETGPTADRVDQWRVLVAFNTPLTRV